jgi:hypothetical protein
MKKILLLCSIVIFLSGCTDKQQYEQAVLEQMKNEKDVEDYHIDPQYMTECIVDLSSEKMPGMFAYDPYRLKAYRNYAKMLNVTKTEDPKKTLEELRQDFGSPKKLAEAHANYTESVMNCFAAIIMETEEKAKEDVKAGKKDNQKKP